MTSASRMAGLKWMSMWHIISLFIALCIGRASAVKILTSFVIHIKHGVNARCEGSLCFSTITAVLWWKVSGVWSRRGAGLQVWVTAAVLVIYLKGAHVHFVYACILKSPYVIINILELVGFVLSKRERKLFNPALTHNWVIRMLCGMPSGQW